MNEFFKDWIKNYRNANNDEIIKIIKSDKNKMQEIEKQQEIFRKAKKEILKYIYNNGKDVKSESLKILNKLKDSDK